MTKDKNIFILNIYYMLTYAFRELKQNNYERFLVRISTTYNNCLPKFSSRVSHVN